jgi:hypothetical protein
MSAVREERANRQGPNSCTDTSQSASRNYGHSSHTNEDEQTGCDIWHQFTQVVTLEEQMRQAEDGQCRDLLRRARNAQLSTEYLTLLNSKVVFDLHSMVSVVR